MSREPEIDQLFVRLRNMADQFAVAPHPHAWELVEGDGDGQRSQWSIQHDGVVIVPLGYTRRQVLASLTSMCSILAVLLGV